MSEIISHYDDYYVAPDLSQWRALGAKGKAANIMALWDGISASPPHRLLDIGCGDGAVTQILCDNGFGETIAGFDVSRSGISIARQRNLPIPSGFHEFDGAHLPLDDKSFDLAILSHVIEHLEHPRILLREAARVSRYVFVEVPLELHARTRREFVWTDLGHINLYNPLLIRHLIQSVGLRVLGELITCPQRAAFTHERKGLAGSARWAVKAGLLKVLPFVACRVFTYHCSIIADDSSV